MDDLAIQVEFTNFLADGNTPQTPAEPQRPDGIDEDEYKRFEALREAAGFVRDKFQIAKDDRKTSELIWLQSWHSFRGEYTPDERKRLEEMRKINPYASSTFVKITKTKTLAAHGQLLEVLEGSDRFPIVVEPTPVPEGAEEFIHVDPMGEAEQAPLDPYGYEGDGRELPKGATFHSLMKGLSEGAKNLLSGKSLKEGPSPDKRAAPQLKPAQKSAIQMDKLIQDQLLEEDARHALRRACLECSIYGTGIIKGPLTYEKTFHDWQRGDGGDITYTPVYKKHPKIEFVSIWDFYPDPDADNMFDAEWAIQRRRMSRSQLRQLRFQPTFDKAAIDEVLQSNPDYDIEEWENQLNDNGYHVDQNRYEVLEYWGPISRELAQYVGLDIPESIQDLIHVNLWVVKQQVIRAVVNPFVPQNIPYLAVPYEEHPHQIWGVGVPENMIDVQDIMNASINMAFDNLRFGAQGMLEINEDFISPNQDYTVYPGKVWYSSGPKGQAISSLNFTNNAPANIQMYDKARQLADEKTGIASYSHGQTGVSGTTRTASGMSMLMGASALNIKTVIKNFDHFLLKPLGERLFAWNMQFNTDRPDIRGDLTIKASGTSSLMQKEVRSQRILSLFQIGANPLIAPFIDFESGLRELAISMDLDPETFVNDQQMAAFYAEQIAGKMNVSQSQQGSVPGTDPAAGAEGGNSPQPATGGVNPQDPTGAGGGNIGIGTSAGPGQGGFSARPQ